MATSNVGLDQADLIARLKLVRAVAYIFFEGERFAEPEPTKGDEDPADWLVPRLIRDEGRAFNVENQQKRAVRLAVWLAFQPGRGNFQGRLDLIMADLVDKMSLERNTNSNSMDGSSSYLGPAEPPAGLNTSQPWDWRAVFFDGTFYEQV